MFRYLTISLFLLPSFLGAQTVIMPAYEASFDAPIKIERNDVIKSPIPGYFINERRYAFYRKLHEFANDAEFKGHEREILDGFGGFLTESDEILKKMSENTSKLEDSSERLKTAQDAVDALNAQVDELARQNAELKRKISEPVKQKKKFAVPLFMGIAAGVIIGVLVN